MISSVHIYVLPCLLPAINNIIITLKYVSVSHPVDMVVFLWDVNSKFTGQKETFSFDSLKTNIL